MEADTASLRKAAPQWSLAGDKELLDMLQKIHQKIMTKCEEANAKLDIMVDALDNASIDLQNVNNKFMALSNSQFVESRVYDDDVDVSTEGNTSKCEPPQVAAESETVRLKRSLQRFEQMHEPVHILDSDSSDDEDMGRIILKPKEVYSHRPLPYIIGSQAWKNKWHAGLIQEESDSDSSVSKHDNIPAEEYSDSEPETATTDKLAHRTISSSSFESEVTSLPQAAAQATSQAATQATSQATKQPAKPADIAAELARRLGGPLQLPASEPVPIDSPPVPTTTKVYRMEKPAPTTVFSDEPPPIDDYQSYKSDYTDDDDIFAELHKKPNVNTNRDQSRVASDLFGGLDDSMADDLFGEVQTRGDIGNIVDEQGVKSSNSGVKKVPSTSIFQEQKESNPVTETLLPKPKSIDTNSDTGAVKKPVGGISLFGTNKGAESIGAAILKRNIRKSSTSDEDTSNASEIKEKPPNITKTKEEPVNKIIEDLFNKPSKKVTKKEDTIRREEPEKVKPVKEKIDLFSDNIFDDIDDIFTTSIVTKPKDNKPQKSIFDDDDLFADITTKKPDKHSEKSNTKSIFDSSDDLFSESEKKLKGDVIIPSNLINVNNEDLIIAKPAGVNTISNRKGLFDDDSEDDLFSDVKVVKNNSKPLKHSVENVTEMKMDTEHNDNKSPIVGIVNNDVNKLLDTNSERKSLSNPVTSKTQLESPSLFDDDEFDDLFTAKTKSTIKENKIVIEENQNKETIESNEAINKGGEPIKRDNVAEMKQTISELNKQLGIVEAPQLQYDSPPKTNIVDADVNNGCIQDEIVKSEITQPKGNLASSHKDVINNILDQKEGAKTSYLTDLRDVTNEQDYSKHPESINRDLNDILHPENITSESNDQGTFSDIFPDMPPDFEKPLEPKRSKNVNALFDDDSDDEALFFKKSEAISDEKPDLNYSSDRFRIFHDEPPEIDIDFTQKTLKNDQSFLNELPDDDLFADSIKTQENNEQVLKDNTKEANEIRHNVNVDEENKLTNEIDITKLIEDSKKSVQNENINVSKLLESFEDNNENESGDQTSKIPKVKETESIRNEEIIEESEPKKSVGKLKPINLNINVNTLLPGASLKKVKSNEETDGQAISTKSNEELNIHSPDNTDSEIVKSISFDGDPESEILDNKLSKQRAKIQVKRRPSSRRARLEAVRKSRIDLASDSTDNSSSFDEPPYKEIINKERVTDKVQSPITLEKSVKDNVEGKTISVEEKTITEQYPDVKPPSLESQQNPTDALIDTRTTQADVKSKVVYILNDEDIFNDINPRQDVNSVSSTTQSKKVLDILDDDDDELLFKTPNISTLGKTYEKINVSSSSEAKSTVKIESVTTIAEQRNENKVHSSGIVKDNLPKAKKSIFDDLSDEEEELFGSKKPAVQKTSIFDSDSAGPFFVKNKRDTKTPVVAKKETGVKGSLFGDESDDDDLFGVKSSKQSGNVKQNTPKPKEVTSKNSEPVFEDPLSMFGDDD